MFLPITEDAKLVNMMISSLGAKYSSNLIEVFEKKSAMAKLTTVPRDQTLLAFTVRNMEFLAAQSRAERLRRRLGLPDPEGKGPRPAADIAATMTPENLNM